MKYHVSDYLRYPDKGHAHFNFVDVDLNDDNLLFIDPCLLEVSENEFGIEASAVLQNFFDNLYDAIRNRDRERYDYLLEHAGERNATKLGYGNGRNGRGNSPVGLSDKLLPLWSLIPSISMKRPMDPVVFIYRFGPDGISDMITNIICRQLLKFTQEECEKQHEVHLTDRYHWYWDKIDEEWKEERISYPTYRGESLLFVPKDCVRNPLVFGVGHYLSKAVLDREKQESRYIDENGKVRYTSKEELKKRIPKDTSAWSREYITNYTRVHPEILPAYHDYLSSIYRNKKMSNEVLDRLLYKKR